MIVSIVLILLLYDHQVIIVLVDTTFKETLIGIEGIYVLYEASEIKFMAIRKWVNSIII